MYIDPKIDSAPSFWQMRSSDKMDALYNRILASGKVSASVLSLAGVFFLPVKTYVDVDRISRDQEKMCNDMVQMRSDIDSIKHDIHEIMRRMDRRWWHF